MATTSSNSWMPTQGRHPAKVGKSLTRVIKARKGEPPQKSKFPEQDFYSLRYNFIPPSVDSTKPGTIEVRKSQDTTNVTVERANSQTEEGGHIFVGTETTAKEVECVLIYDEVLGSFTLEKLDSYVNLTYDHKTTKPPRHTGSPLPSSRPSASTAPSSSNLSSGQSQQKKRAQTAAEEFEAELERSLLGEDEDAPGGHEDGQLPPERQKKLVPPKKDVAPGKKEKALSFKKTRVSSPAQTIIKKEEEESEPETALAATIAPKAPVKAQKKSLAAYVRAKNATPPPTSTPPVPPTHPLPPKPVVSLDAAQTKTAKTAKTSPKKRELPSDIQSQPSPVTKKAKPSPPPKPTPTPRVPSKKDAPKKKEPVALALPGSDSVALPSAPLELPGPSQATSMVPTAPDDSDNEEWDLVPETASANSGKAKSPEPPTRNIEMIEIIPEPTTHVDPAGVSDTLVMEEVDESEGDYEAVDIDENELQLELQRVMEAHSEDEEDDGDMELVEQPFSGAPMSLNNYVSQIGGVDDDDSDDDTTSDESD